MIEELDFQETRLGELLLWKRTAIEYDGREVYEVKLNDEYLMSSMFVDGEVALTDLGLAALEGEDCDVVVGGLGLGYTAAAALANPCVSRLVVVEALAPVIDWHQRKLVPNGELLTDDARCTYYNADFFALARGGGFDPEREDHVFDAVLLDIDHTPDALLNPTNGDLYTVEGIQRLARFVRPDGGVFAMWSNEAPDEAFLDILRAVFETVEGHTVEFANPIQGGTAVNGVYVAKTRR